MKNIHIIPTDKPSRLSDCHDNKLHLDDVRYLRNYQNIYITKFEEIKEGVDQWYLDKVLNEPYNSGGAQYASKQEVIILTTNEDLIKDGVQAINDEFLEWFVKNPTCEEVEVGYGWIRLTETDNEGYWISIPDKQFEMQQEEPKQETLEDVAYRLYPIILEDDGWDKNKQYRDEWTKGVKWQQKNSEEEVIQLVSDWTDYRMSEDTKSKVTFKKWFKQFKE